MKKLHYYIFIGLVGLGFSACDFFDVDEVTNPNAPDASVISTNASSEQIQALVAGLEGRSRLYVGTTSRAFGSFGRETLSYRDSDPRFTTAWLGRAGEPDGGFFAVLNTYDGPFQTIKQANVLMDAAANTDIFDGTQISGINGFAKTVQGYQFLVPLLAQYENGIRVDVSDPLNPGPFVEDFQAALTAVRNVLDAGAADLSGAGGSFPFSLTSGFSGFDTPAGMLQVNRAVAARAAIYAQDWQGALDALGGSFFDMSGDMNAGPAHTYEGADGTVTSNDVDPPNPFNPFFFPLDQFSTQLEVVHPSVLEDLEAGDERGSKFFMRSTSNFVTNQALVEYVATHQDGRFTSNTSNVPFIRNEELVLIYAEANAQLGNPIEAVAAIDAVRSNAGLGSYTGATDTNSLVDQILFERRYSLWFEPLPHRWVDLRRYDRLTELQDDFIADDESFFMQLARPTGESNWDEFFGN